MTESKDFLVVGVMSHPDPAIAMHRRRTVRESWGRHLPTRTILRFVVSQADYNSHETAKPDLMPLPELDDCSACESRLYVFRLLAFLKAALRAYRPRWLMKTDDDAFLRLEIVRRDLRRIEAEVQPGVVYGAVEWQSFSPSQYAEFGWASGEAHAARAWRRAITIKHTDPQNLSWTDIPVVRDKRAWLRTARRIDEHDPQQRPFPFAKGPLLAFDADIARWLTSSDHSLEQQRKIREVRSNRRLLDDLFIAWLLASARAGRGRPNVTWVNIGVEVPCPPAGCKRSVPGLSEFRPWYKFHDAAWSTRSGFACARCVHFGVMRSADHGRHAKLLQVRNFSLALARLHRAKRLTHHGASQPLLHCEAAQPRWSERSEGVVMTGASWQMCRIEGGCNDSIVVAHADGGRASPLPAHLEDRLVTLNVIDGMPGVPSRMGPESNDDL